MPIATWAPAILLARAVTASRVPQRATQHPPVEREVLPEVRLPTVADGPPSGGLAAATVLEA